MNDKSLELIAFDYAAEKQMEIYPELEPCTEMRIRFMIEKAVFFGAQVMLYKAKRMAWDVTMENGAYEIRVVTLSDLCELMK